MKGGNTWIWISLLGIILLVPTIFANHGNVAVANLDPACRDFLFRLGKTLRDLNEARSEGKMNLETQRIMYLASEETTFKGDLKDIYALGMLLSAVPYLYSPTFAQALGKRHWSSRQWAMWLSALVKIRHPQPLDAEPGKFKVVMYGEYWLAVYTLGSLLFPRFEEIVSK